MDSEKQIEEMARIIAKANGNEQDVAYYRPDATDLYNAGYCKASDVAEEIFADIHNTLLKVISIVDEGLDRSIRNDNEDAKIIHAGTLETLKCLIYIFAERKKKYIGEDTNVPTKMEDR